MEDWGDGSMEVDWDFHKLHREQVARDQGQWIGILNADGEPMFDAPPLMSLSAPKIRNSPAAVKAVFGIRSRRGVVHAMVDELVGEDLGRVTAEGALKVSAKATRFVAVERPGGVRRVYRVAYSRVQGQGTAPVLLEVHGNDLVKFLSLFSAMSAPTTWTDNWTTFTRDWVGPEGQEIVFNQPRDLTGMKMVTVADGATVEGPAEATIRRVISESLKASFRVAGVVDDPPIVVSPVGSGVVSPHVLIRPTDQILWDEVAPVAAAAGVVITASMWLPGDQLETDLDLDKPTIVVHVRQSEEVPT